MLRFLRCFLCLVLLACAPAVPAPVATAASEHPDDLTCQEALELKARLPLVKMQLKQELLETNDKVGRVVVYAKAMGVAKLASALDGWLTDSGCKAS